MYRPDPKDIKLYHIVHFDRLTSIIQDGYLWSDSEALQRHSSGTTIGMTSIKERRLHNPLTIYSDLHVGECVPFYFCPRSVMLYMFYRDNHQDITYHGGQEPIIHLVANLQRVVDWAAKNNKKWVFTDSNAGSYYFNDYNDLDRLSCINWTAVHARNWQKYREKKQAEFLLEKQLPYELIEFIGVYSEKQLQIVKRIINSSGHKPPINIMRKWYY